MAKRELSYIEQISLDVYNRKPSTEYSLEDAQKMLKGAIIEACGGTEWSWGRFLDNKNQVFQVISEMFPVAMKASLAGKFDSFAEFKDDQMGDSTTFTVEEAELFKILTAARGTSNTERQTIVNRTFTVPTIARDVKLYAEFDDLMAGRIDWTKMVNKVSDSFANEIGKLISDAIYGSYASIDTNYKATGAFDDDTLDDIIEHVKAANSTENVIIYGATKALSNVSNSAGYSDAAKDIYNMLGHFGVYNGVPLVSLPQAYGVGTQSFVVDRNYLLILPANEKIVKVVFEGMAKTFMKDGTDRNDLQPEFYFNRRVGVAAITVIAGKFGMYKLS